MEESVNTWYNNAFSNHQSSSPLKEQTPQMTPPIGIPPRKHSGGASSYYYSSSASPPHAAALTAAASQHTKRVNSEMRHLYTKRQLTPDAYLSTTESTVGEYLLEKWMQAQKLPRGKPRSFK